MHWHIQVLFCLSASSHGFDVCLLTDILFFPLQHCADVNEDDGGVLSVCEQHSLSRP